MSVLITWEWEFLLISTMWGMVLAVGYDLIRVVRRVIAHRQIMWLAAEDIVFWNVCGFVIFHVTFMINDGVIRSFSIAGFVTGAVMEQYAFSRILVEGLSRIVKLLLKGMSYLIKPLKIVVKSVKIQISKKIRKSSK